MIITSGIEDMACFKPYDNTEVLKAYLVKLASSIPLKNVCATIDKMQRNKNVLREKGCHFE